MIEMLIAVAVVALIGTAGIMAVGQQDANKVKQAAQQFLIAFERSRLSAVREGQPQTITYKDHQLSYGNRMDEIAPEITIERQSEGASDEFTMLISPLGASDGLLLEFSLKEQRLWLNLDPITGRTSIAATDPRADPWPS